VEISHQVLKCGVPPIRLYSSDILISRKHRGVLLHPSLEIHPPLKVFHDSVLEIFKHLQNRFL